MRGLEHLVKNNQRWARDVERRTPGFFRKLSRQQSPEYLWIGCSDSRVPANEIIGLLPGEVFVHRNVGNLVARADVNCHCVIQYAVDVLKVKHIIVCGHYGCGGVDAALREIGSGFIKDWLRPIRKVAGIHAKALAAVGSDRDRQADKLCELNVVEQVRNVARAPVVGRAWRRGQPLCIHGWIYRLTDGLVRPLGMSVSAASGIAPTYQKALARLLKGCVRDRR
jgi:carbonic anhydrase